MAKHPECALTALRAYATELNPRGGEYQDPEQPTGWDYRTNTVDLLADLMHFADIEYGGTFDFEDALDMARTHYGAELAGAD
jgi:hypothetical protein